MGFENSHPAVNLLYFTAVIFGTLAFGHPIFLSISFLCACLYSVKRNRKKAVVFNIVLLPLIAAFAFWYSSNNHFGLTVLDRNFIGNDLTLESLVYGFVLGFSAAGAVIWLSCVYSVFTSDKVAYLFGRVSPRISLFLSVLLRTVPGIKNQAKQINNAQRGIGRGAGQGNVFVRLRNCIRILSILITRTVDMPINVSESMRSRGGLLRGRKAFSVYRFDNRDRIYVILMFSALTLTAMAVLLGQTDAVYDPKITVTSITPMSFLFYIGYAFLCLMPLHLELWTEYRFRKGRKSVF